MSSKRKSHPMKILSDNQLYPSSKPIFPSQSPAAQMFPNFPMMASPSFLGQTSPDNEEAEEISEPCEDDKAESAETTEASEMTNTKSNNDANVPSQREAMNMNQILKKLALKSQENLKKSKEDNSRCETI